MSDLECQYCSTQYRNPKLLSCGHTYCSKCIEHLVVTNEVTTEALYETLGSEVTLKCPQCACECSKCLVTTDYTTLAAIEEHTWRLCMAHKSASCGVCEDVGQVETFCSTCESFLCSLCTAAHKRMSTFTQHDLSLPDLSTLTFNPKPRAVFCRNHSSVAVNMFCLTCEELICNECMCTPLQGPVQTSHGSHEVHPITDKSLKLFTDKIQHLVTRAKKLQESLDQDMCVLKSQEEMVKVHPEKLKKAVNETVDSWIAAIDKTRQEALNEIDEDYRTTLGQCHDQSLLIADRMKSLESGLRFTSKAMECEGKSTKYSMLAQAQRLLASPVKDPRSVDTPTSCSFYQVKTPRRESTCLSLLVSREQAMNINSIHCVELGKRSSLEVSFKYKPSEPPLFRLTYIGRTKRFMSLSSCVRKDSNVWEVVFTPGCIGRYQLEAQVFGKWISSQPFSTSPLSQLAAGDCVRVSPDTSADLLLCKPVECETGRIKTVQYSSSGSGRTINYCFEISWGTIETIDRHFKFSHLRNSYNPFPLELAL